MLYKVSRLDFKVSLNRKFRVGREYIRLTSPVSEFQKYNADTPLSKISKVVGLGERFDQSDAMSAFQCVSLQTDL